MRSTGIPLDDGTLQVRCTDRGDGDLRVDGEPSALDGRRRAVVDRPWVWLRQVHGREVVVVGDHDEPAAVAGARADAVVTARTDVALAVHGADCGILALWSPEGVVGAVHAGWKGLEAGVVDAAATRMRELGAGSLAASAGPCIGPECYGFGRDDLDRLRRRLGPDVVGATATGSPALDLPAALSAALRGAGVEEHPGLRTCTACAAREHWSHRARGEEGRQALVAWVEPVPSPG